MGSTDWIKLLIGAGPPLLLNVYQFLFPRSLSRLKYRIIDETRPADAAFVEMRGKRFEIVSCGNRAAQSVLIHIVMRHRIIPEGCGIDSSVKPDKPYGSRPEEMNIPFPSLNPGEKVIARVHCMASECKAGEDVMLEHRITHSEKAARRVRRWIRRF
jgi:hypothetical protein